MQNPKCPRCGSSDTAKYLYGMPVYDKSLIQKIEDGQIITGGCYIESNESRFHCNACQKDFGFGTQMTDGADLLQRVSAIIFRVAGPQEQHIQLEFERERKGAVCQVEKSGVRWERSLTEKEWVQLLEKLFYRLFLLDWKRVYVRKGDTVHDTRWRLTLLVNQKKNRFEFRGSNDFPVYWKMLLRLFQPYLEE